MAELEHFPSSHSSHPAFIITNVLAGTESDSDTDSSFGRTNTTELPQFSENGLLEANKSMASTETRLQRVKAVHMVSPLKSEEVPSREQIASAHQFEKHLRKGISFYCTIIAEHPRASLCKYSPVRKREPCIRLIKSDGR